MIRLDIKNCNMILTEEQQKNHHDHWEKVINMNTLTGEESLSSNQTQIIGQAKFPYYSLQKSFEKQTKMIED